MGVVSMLIVPMLLSLCAVKVKQSKDRAEKIVTFRNIELEAYSKKNIVANAELQVYDEKAQLSKEEADAQEMLLHERDTHELTAEEVDWKAQNQ